MKKIAELKPLAGYRLWLRFDDGVEGTVDLSENLGVGVFKLWDDPVAFANVRIGDFGEAVWSEAVDLCPDALYLQLTGLTPQDLFPSLAAERTHAGA